MESKTTHQREDDRHWTPERVAAAASSFYPLCESGPLCPLLNDPKLLFEFYIAGGLRQSVKKFLKTHQWKGRPESSYAMNDEVLTKLLHSMCSSPEARRLLSMSRESIKIHNVIWNWLNHTNKDLFKSAQKFAHQNEAGKYFMTPAELGAFLDDQLTRNGFESEAPLVYIGMAYAMLEPDSRNELLAEVLCRFPGAASGLGVDVDSQEAIPQSLEPERSTAFSQPDEREVAPIDSEPDELDTPMIAKVCCWVPQIDQLVQDTEELLAESERFAGSARELAKIGFFDAFSDGGDISSQLASLDEQRSTILKQSNTILSALAVFCDGVAPSACELDCFMCQIRANPPRTIQDLEVVTSSMRDKASGLQSKTKDVRKEIADLKSKAAELACLLDITDPSPQSPATDSSPCKTLAALSAQQAVLTELRRNMSAEVIRRRDAVSAEVERVATQYDLAGSAAAVSPASKECRDFYEALRKRIATAEDFGDVIECKKQLGELRAKCQSAERSDYRKLAGRLLKDTEAFNVFLQLCRATLDQGLPEIAQLLFFVRQRAHMIEEIAEVPDEALSLLIESTCATSEAQLPRDTVWDTLCQSNWLRSIGHHDIESAELHDCIIVTLMAAALGGRGDDAANILVRLGATDLSRQRLPEAMDALLQAIISRREVQIATPEDLNGDLQLRESLEESLAHDCGKFRHIQCGKAHHFARFETVIVFPALVELWERVSQELRQHQFSSACKSVDGIDVNDWYAELQRSADKKVEEHPLFTDKIKDFMSNFVTRLQAYVAGRQKMWGGEQHVVEQTELVEALKKWAGGRAAKAAVARLMKDAVYKQTRQNSQTMDFWDAIGRCPSIVLHCPRFVLWLREQRDPAATQEVEQTILDDLHAECSIENTVQLLESNSAWERLTALPVSSGLDANPEWPLRQAGDFEDLTKHRKEVQALENPPLLDTFDACVGGGRVEAARGILDQANTIRAKIREENLREAIVFANKQLSLLETVKDGAAFANMPIDWLDTITNLASKIDMQLRRSKQAEDADQAPTESLKRLARAVEALKFVVDEKSTNFDEVEHVLNPAKAAAEPVTMTTEEKKEAYAKCPDLHDAWGAIANTDAADLAETTRSWSRFVKEFAKVCNLYRDEHDEQHRFTTDPSVKYPFTVFETAFHKPQSEFLKRPLRLYLYRQRDVDSQALQRLEDELITGPDAAARLHVVFAPQGYERISRYFHYGAAPRDFLLVNEDFFCRVSGTDKHDVPLRQALHGAVTDLANSSPFVAQGYCHQNNNIYVGRNDILKKLQNTPHAMIWGGRRIGKTSVLHALENTLRKTKNYRVAYVYVDLQDTGDPDLSVAKKISATLGLPEPATIPEFEKQISALRKDGVHLAFLIDEVDEYIKKSREINHDKFPLATTLRQLVMDDADKDTRLVYSGYHQLYFEAKLDRDKRRVGHPFVNICQGIPIRNLNPDDVKKLVTTGFEDMLGIRVNPDVPNLIFRRASGHPAFVQQFCRCLLDRVSCRRSATMHVTITADDVEAVYNASTKSENGEDAFITYVDETLGYNLSHLGRAIMLTVCNLPVAQAEAENEAAFFSIQKLSEELNSWCEYGNVPKPEQMHFEQTVELLVMTNMLTQNPQKHDSYRVTYPTYIDILKRLDKLKPSDFGHSLQEYSKNERERGVLL